MNEDLYKHGLYVLAAIKKIIRFDHFYLVSVSQIVNPFNIRFDAFGCFFGRQVQETSSCNKGGGFRVISLMVSTMIYE